MPFPKAVLLFGSVHLTFDICPLFSEHLPGARLHMAEDERTKMPRILSIGIIGRWRLVMFWGGPPRLWEFQGEERQGCLNGCAETSSLGHLQVSQL